jgi:hypothetical protein
LTVSYFLQLINISTASCFHSHSLPLLSVSLLTAMSASPSLPIRNVSDDKGVKRRDPALVLEIPDVKSLSDGLARDSPPVKKPPPIQTTQVRPFLSSAVGNNAQGCRFFPR